MTWAIDAILAAVLVGLVWLGAKRGLMKSLAGVISVGAAFFGASWCANRFVTPVSRWLEPLLRESIQQKLSGQDGADAGELLSAFAFDAHSLEKILEDVAQRVKETGESGVFRCDGERQPLHRLRHRVRRRLYRHFAGGMAAAQAIGSGGEAAAGADGECTGRRSAGLYMGGAAAVCGGVAHAAI